MATYRYMVPGDDFSLAGRASGDIKRILQRLGAPPCSVKRLAVAMYEAELNMVIHAGGGIAEVEVLSDRVMVTLADEGPGIPDLELAMTEGYSTATERVREMGFGAGMGLSNMKRNADELVIDTAPGRGTTVRMTILMVPAREAP